MADVLTAIKLKNKGYNVQQLVIPQAVKASGTYDLKTFATAAAATKELDELKRVASLGLLQLYFQPSSGTATTVIVDENGVGFTSAVLSDKGKVLKVALSTSTTKLQVAFTTIISES